MNELKTITRIKIKFSAAMDTILVILKHFPDLGAAEKEAEEYNKKEKRKYRILI